MPMAGEADQWFAVRCIFQTAWPPEARWKTYEERITLWQAQSADEAIVKAEAEARDYAAAIDESPDVYLGLAQSYRLEGAPANGTEIFSLMRDSELGPAEYVERFFSTGRGHIEDA